MSGWIKLHRAIEGNPLVTKDNDHFRLWIHFLLQASHKQTTAIFNNEKIILNPGQFISGRKNISLKIGIHESKVRRIIKVFKIDQQIDQQISAVSSLFTITNWKRYQIDDHQNDQQVTNERPTSDQQVTTIKELKNIRRKEEEADQKDRQFEIFWNLYQKKEKRPSAEKAFKQLSFSVLQQILEHVPKYVTSTPDIRYRLQPANYLIERKWEDEIFVTFIEDDNPIITQEKIAEFAENNYVG